MSKTLKFILAAVAVLIVLLFVAFKVMQSNTKKHSPEDTVSLSTPPFEIEVFYNRPFKKGRTIFGELVPFGEVWRTGANEATTFATQTDLQIGQERLSAGKYTLWTIPGGSEWQIIFNEQMYRWGVNLSGEASRDGTYDVLTTSVPVEKLGSTVEQFTIAIEAIDAQSGKMILTWDKTRVVVPFKSLN